MALAEQLHARPRARTTLACSSALDEPTEKLARSCRLDEEIGANETEVGRERTKDARGPEWSNDLVVPHEDDEQVGFVMGAFLGNQADDVGVDRDHGGVDHLEARLGKAFAKHDFQNVRENAGRIWEAHRG
jgi:hypothetical protein